MEFLFYHLRVSECWKISSPAAPGNPIIIISRRRALKFGVFLQTKGKDFLWGREIN